jgi:ATP-dependent Clp protease ATP-binding subunit ClpC
VFNILLQVFDDGRLTDSQGRTVNFKNTVIIMTSNIGSDLISGTRQAVGFPGAGETSAADSERDQLMRRLREHFRPEFLNRIDDIIVFRRLEPEQLRQITELLLEDTKRRLHAQKVTVEFTPAAIDLIAQRGYQPEFGARPMRRVIQRDVDTELSAMLLRGTLNPGQTVRVDAREGELTFETVEAAAAAR